MNKKTSNTKSKAKPTKPNNKTVGRINVEVDKDSSIRIEKIENGYIVAESGTTGKGKNIKYYDRRYFSPTNPVQIATGGKVKFGGKR